MQRVPRYVVAFVPLALAACSGSQPATSAVNDAAAIDGATDATAERLPFDSDASPVDGSVLPADAPAGDASRSAADAGACSLPASDASAPSGTCNALTPLGPIVQETCAAGSAPVAHGGTIADGTYALESVVYYGACPTTLTLDQIVWVICGAQWQTAQAIASTTTRYDIVPTFGAAPGTVTLGLTCPQGSSPPAYTYDASPNRFSLHLPLSTGNTVEVDTYVKQ